MDCKTNKIVLLGLICFVLFMTAPPLCRPVTLPVPEPFQEKLETLIKEYQQVTLELDRIRTRLDRDVEKATQADYEKDTKRLFTLMDELAEKKKAIKKMRQELDDFFTEPPVLKLVRITGPTGAQARSETFSGRPVEIDYAPNSAGYTRRVKDSIGRLYSSAGVAVTYAPLEIKPGEPFHFEVEARQTAFLDASQGCTGSDPFHMGVQIDPDNSFHSPTVALSKTDLKCGPGSVKLTMRFKPQKPVLHPTHPFHTWDFPYDMEAVTTGAPLQGHPFKAGNEEIVNFGLTVKKSAIDMADRVHYKFDVSVRPRVFDGSLASVPEIVLHYRPQDESIAFLPEYRFPEDTADYRVAIPDVKGLAGRDAKDKLTQRRLDPIIKPGPPAPRPELSGKVALQKPEPGERVKLHAKVDITVYSDFMSQKTTLPDFSGKPMKEAKAWMKEKGLKVRLAATGPAPSSALSFTVKETEPGAGEKLAPETEVIVRVYGKYSPRKVTVPNLSGMSIKEAKARLKAQGFTTKLAALGPAPNQALSFKVKETAPKAGSSRAMGDEITIKVYGKFVQKFTTVPRVAGLSAESATAELRQKGLIARLAAAGAAPSRAQANKVEGSVPKAGAKVAEGAEVQIRVFSTYKPSKAELVSQLDCSGYPGSRSYWDQSAGKPLCGCPGELVWNGAGTRCISRTNRDRERCAQSYPGSIPGSRNANGDLVCNCPNGYGWTGDRTRCVKRIRRQPARARETNNRGNNCAGLLLNIKTLVGIANASPNKSSVFKFQIETAANDARRNGCREAAIQQAMGSYATRKPAANRRRAGSGGPVILKPSGDVTSGCFGTGDVVE